MPHRLVVVQHFSKTTNLLPSPSKAPTKTECHYANIEREMLAVIFRLRDSELTSMVGPLPLNQTTSPWNPSPKRTWQTHQPSYSTCYCTSRVMTTSSITTPVRKWLCLMPSLTLHFSKPLWVILRCTLLPTSSSPVDPMTSRWFLAPYILTGNIMRPSLLKMALPSVEKPSLFLHQKGEITTPTTPVPSRYHQIPVAHTWMYLLAWYKQSHWRSCLSMWDLHCVPSPECCNTSHSYANSIPPMVDVCLRHLYSGRSWLPHMWWLLLNLVWCLPSGQSNTAKVISLLNCCKEMFSEHGIPEALHSDNGPQYVSAQFADFCTSWGITCETSSPHYPQPNGFVEACVKSVNHALQHAKYSSANAQLTLLVLQATSINAKLPITCQAPVQTPAQDHHPCQNLKHWPCSTSSPWIKLLPVPTPPNHRLINTVYHLHPCMLDSQLPCMMPFGRFGSLLQWYASYPRTATRYAPGVVLFTTAWDDTRVNAVSSPLTLFQMLQQPHHRLLPDPVSLHHSLHPLGLHSPCYLHLLHPTTPVTPEQ